MSIYLDNAATSYPKPPSVISAVVSAMTEAGANPGRGSHDLSIRAAELLFHTRETVCRYFGAEDPMDFFFTLNCTDALNTAIKGLLNQGDHAITSIYDHNSVLRPLEYLKRSNKIDYSTAFPDKNGKITVDCIRRLMRPETKMVVLSHISNVTGQICDITEIGAYCREKKVLFITDAAQSAGIIPFNLKDMPIDILCTAGHKGLYGPQGSGILYIRSGIDAEPLRHGGTGSLSDSIDQPILRPDRYESGTVALPAIAGLCKGIEMLEKAGNYPQRHESELAQRLMQALRKINGLVIYSPENTQGGIVACNIAGIDSGLTAQELNRRFAIACRSGLHCAPLAHRYLGTFQSGIVRFSIGMFNTAEEIDRTAEAMKELAAEFTI